MKIIILLFSLGYFGMLQCTLSFSMQKQANSGLNRDNLIVKFDPFISDEDVWVQNSYKKEDIIPMLEKVHQGFGRILVELTSELDANKNSRNLVPVAAANYNNKTPGSKASNKLPLQVWISEDVGNQASYLVNLTMNAVRNLTYNINRICPGTIPVLMLDYSRQRFEMITKENIERDVRTTRGANGNSTYQVAVGIPLSHDEFSESFVQTMWTDLLKSADIAVLTVQHEGKKFLTESIENKVDYFTKRFTKVKEQIQGNLSIPVVLQTSWPDTDIAGYTSYFNLVDFWKRISKWATVTNTSVILDGAFDVPYRPERIFRTTGWWRLIPNGSYITSGDYRFEEKSAFVEENNGTLVNSRANMTLANPKENVTFSREYVAIRLNPFEVGTADLRRNVYNVSSLKNVIKVVSQKFKKIYIDGVPQRYPSSNLSFLPEVVAELNRDGHKNNLTQTPTEIIFSFTGRRDRDTDAITWFENLKNLAENANSIHSNTVTTFLLKAEHLRVKSIKNIMSHASNISQHMFKLGVIQLASKCSGPMNGSNFQNNVASLLESGNLHILGFGYRVYEDMVRLGLARIMARVIALFDSCKRKIHQVAPEVTVIFFTNWPTRDDNGQENYAQLVNYWEEMGRWAAQTNSTVIFEDAFDEFDYEGKVMSTSGWWKFIWNESNPMASDISIVEKKSIVQRILQDEVKNSTGGSKPAPSIGALYIVGIIGATLALFLIVVLASLLYFRRSEKMRKIARIFFRGDAGSSDSHSCVPYDKETWELPKGLFFIDMKQHLGSGQFGQVYRGLVTRKMEGDMEEVQISVAVKMCRDETRMKALLSEIKVLAYLTGHENIVGLVGAYTAELEQGKVCVFVEMCELGSLLEYLRRLDQETTRVTPTLREDLDRWSREIVNGMEFMAEKRVIHGDLATRNILLTLEKTAKISDFGLSRRLYNYTQYVKKQEEPLPWRWMAPESLSRMEFTEKTDVWAFGVTLWEIYSLGDMPFQGLVWSVDFVQMLEDGLRLAIPKCTESDNAIYQIMVKCWNVDSNLRPKFSEIGQELLEMHSTYTKL